MINNPDIINYKTRNVKSLVETSSRPHTESATTTKESKNQ